MKRVHLSYLDSTRFSTDRYAVGAVREAEANAAEMVKLSLTLFGEVTVLAHELLDIDTLRDGPLRSLLTGPRPFVTVTGWQTTFASTLAYNLRRLGSDAIVFSSVPRGQEVAQDWTRIAAGLLGHSDDDVLTAAQDYEPYRRLVQGAVSLDADRVAINPVRLGVPSLTELLTKFDGVFSGIVRPPGGWPSTHSEAHHLARRCFGSDLVSVNRFLEPFDVATRLRYSALSQSFPFLDFHRSVDQPGNIADATIIRAETSGTEDSLVLDEARYRKLVEFRRKLRDVSISDFMTIAADGDLYRKRQQSWNAYQNDRAGAERLLNSLLEDLDRRLPSAQRQSPSPEGSIVLWEAKIPVQLLVSAWRTLQGWASRPAIHQVVAFHPRSDR